MFELRRGPPKISDIVIHFRGGGEGGETAEMSPAAVSGAFHHKRAVPTPSGKRVSGAVMTGPELLDLEEPSGGAEMLLEEEPHGPALLIPTGKEKMGNVLHKLQEMG
jgi:hypothetical protein